MPLSPIILLAAVFAIGAAVAVLLRLFSVSWGKALAVGLIALPLALAAGGALTYGLVVVIKTLKLEVGGLVFGALATLTIGSAGGVAMSRNAD